MAEDNLTDEIMTKKMAEDNLTEEIMTKSLKDVCLVVIVAGSDSDKEHITKITTSLDKYLIPYIIRICSAHKQPEKLIKIIGEYNNNNVPLVYISVAGGTDALSGTLSYHASYPVISCPPDGFNQSCLTNPVGSPNAYIAKPENVARFIAQVFSGIIPEYKLILTRENREKNRKLEEADSSYA